MMQHKERADKTYPCEVCKVLLFQNFNSSLHLIISLRKSSIIRAAWSIIVKLSTITDAGLCATSVANSSNTSNYFSDTSWCTQRNDPMHARCAGRVSRRVRTSLITCPYTLERRSTIALCVHSRSPIRHL